MAEPHETDEGGGGARGQLAAIFRDLAAFKGALAELLAAGFDRGDVSVLAPHEAVRDHFDGRIPAPEALADEPGTPRETLEAKGALEAAVRFIAESLSVIGALGASGAAFAVGGPVGVATGAGAALESTVEGVLSRFVDGAHDERFRATLRDGGLVCWVRVRPPHGLAEARRILAAHGGTGIHEVSEP